MKRSSLWYLPGVHFICFINDLEVERVTLREEMSTRDVIPSDGKSLSLEAVINNEIPKGMQMKTSLNSTEGNPRD